MKNPFKKGDVVYHPVHGEGKVYMNPQKDSEQVAVKFKDLDYTIRGYSVENTAILSFKPWPKADHERPFEPTFKAGQRVIAIAKGNSSLQHFGIVVNETVQAVKLKLYDKTEIFAKSSYHFYLKVEL